LAVPFVCQLRKSNAFCVASDKPLQPDDRAVAANLSGDASIIRAGRQKEKSLMTANHDPDPMACSVAELRRLAEQFHVCHYVTDGRLVVRRHRGTRPDVHAALIARRDEVMDHIVRTRPDPRDEDAEWDAASVRATGLPIKVFEALVIAYARGLLLAVDQGRIAYQPPLPPWWRDDDGGVR